MISILFIVLAVVFGFMVYRRNVSLGVSTIAGVAAIVVCVVVGLTSIRSISPRQHGW